MVLASALGGLHVAQRSTEGVSRTIVVPAFLVVTTALFQTIRTVTSPVMEWSAWTLEHLVGRGLFSLVSEDLQLASIDWGIALHEVRAAAATLPPPGHRLRQV